jgi:lipoprotein-releasing system permease protein
VFRSFLSWRYLFARRTNLIGIVGIFVAVGALILILSIMTGFLEESRKTVRGSLADILVQPVFGPRRAGPDVPREPGPLLEVIRADPRVAGAAPQLLWGGILTQRGGKFERVISSPTLGDLLAIQLVGIDVHTAERVLYPLVRVAVAAHGGSLPPRRVQDEFDASALLASLQAVPGAARGDRRFPSDAEMAVANPLFPFLPPPGRAPPGRPRASAIIGEQLYQSLFLERGEVIQIATAVYDPAREDWVVSNREFVIAGTFRTGENETDLARIYVERAELADFLGDTRRFTQVLVRVRDYDEHGVELRDALRADLAEAGLIQGERNARYEVLTWEEFRGNLLGAIENERVLMAIMLSLVLVVAGFTIFAILSMMVTEKRRDVGILCALGATPKGVLQLFLMVAFWDALLGAVAGAVGGTWAAIEIDAIERWLSSTFDVQIFNRDVYLFDHIPSIVQPLSVAAIVLGAFTCALLFAALPAWRAARLDPLDALRYE